MVAIDIAHTEEGRAVYASSALELLSRKRLERVERVGYDAATTALEVRLGIDAFVRREGEGVRRARAASAFRGRPMRGLLWGGEDAALGQPPFAHMFGSRNLRGGALPRRGGRALGDLLASRCPNDVGLNG